MYKQIAEARYVNSRKKRRQYSMYADHGQRTYACMHVHMRITMHAYIAYIDCVDLKIYIYAFSHIYTTNMHVFTHTLPHVRTHTRTHVMLWWVLPVNTGAVSESCHCQTPSTNSSVSPIQYPTSKTINNRVKLSMATNNNILFTGSNSYIVIAFSYQYSQTVLLTILHFTCLYFLQHFICFLDIVY